MHCGCYSLLNIWYNIQAQMYEVVYEVYNIIIPIHVVKRQYTKLAKIHDKLAKCYKKIISKEVQFNHCYGNFEKYIIQFQGDKRFFETYYRVGFYGNIFGEDVNKQFIYRKQCPTPLVQFSSELEKSYCKKYGSDRIVIIKVSSKVQPEKLDQNKGYIQITCVEPYFDEHELRLPERTTKFDRSFNICKFNYISV